MILKPDGVTGVIRKGSYTQKAGEGNTTISTLLIDIPAAERTYKIWSSGSGGPEGIIAYSFYAHLTPS